jgi:hypothetical protein
MIERPELIQILQDAGDLHPIATHAGLADTVRFFGDIYGRLPVYNSRALPNPYYEG